MSEEKVTEEKIGGMVVEGGNKPPGNATKALTQAQINADKIADLEQEDSEDLEVIKVRSSARVNIIEKLFQVKVWVPLVIAFVACFGMTLGFCNGTFNADTWVTEGVKAVPGNKAEPARAPSPSDPVPMP